MEQGFVSYSFGNFVFFNIIIPAVFALVAYLVGFGKGKNSGGK